jgi:AraC-like DNA-binding protein
LARDLFAELLTAWRNDGKSETHRSLRCHAALSRLLLLHQPAQVRVPRAAPDAWPVRLWWNIENQARQNLGRAWTLADLASLASASPATVHRASLAAVGMPPVRRIKSLRLEMARGLLVYSGDGIAEIAARAGYERVNEFSRDMRKLFGMPPSKIREGKASQVDSPLRP